MSKWDAIWKRFAAKPLRAALSHPFSGVGTNAGISSFQFAQTCSERPSSAFWHIEIYPHVWHYLTQFFHRYQTLLIDLRGPSRREWTLPIILTFLRKGSSAHLTKQAITLAIFPPSSWPISNYAPSILFTKHLSFLWIPSKPKLPSFPDLYNILLGYVLDFGPSHHNPFLI